MNDAFEITAQAISDRDVRKTRVLWLYVLAPLLVVILYGLGIAFERSGHLVMWDLVVFILICYVILSFILFGRMSAADSWLTEGIKPAGLLLLLVCLFILPIVESFRLNITNSNVMLGFVPWSDAEAYIWGGWQMLVDGSLSEWHQRRPINASVMELRLLLAGFDLHALVLWNSVIIALSTLYAFLELEKHVGRLAALLFTLAIFGYAQPYLPSTLSEVLGLALGLVAFGSLLRAARLGSVSLFAIGLAL